MARATLSTPVLDTTNGVPAAGVEVALYRDGTLAAQGTTGTGRRGGMTGGEQIAVLDAHPRIGADPAWLSLDPRREQGEATDAATARELAELNDAYERKFGFRFVVFVAGRPKREIVPVLRARLANTRETELRAGLDEFFAIALDRLERPG